MKCSISSRRFFFVLILLLNLTAVPGFSQAGQPVPYYFPGASVNTDIVIANIKISYIPRNQERSCLSLSRHWTRRRST